MTYQQAIAHIDAENFVDALRTLDRVLMEEPQRADAYYQRGRVRLKLGDAAGATADFTKAIRLEPTAEAYLSRAVLRLAEKNLSAAVEDAQQAVALNPQLAPAHRLLGKAYRQQDYPDRAIAAYKAAARAYLAQNDKANAQDCLAQIEQIQAPTQTVTPPQPITPPQSITPPKPAPAPLMSPEAFLQQARSRAKQGQYEQALGDLNWFLKFDPDHVEALCDRSAVLAKLGQGEAAIRDMARAFKLQSGPDLYLKRGELRLVLGDVYGAVDDFTHVMTEQGHRPELFLQRGRGYQQLQDFDNAFKDFSNGIGNGSDNAELYCARGEVQDAMGDKDGAIADYQRAASLWLEQGHWAGHQRMVSRVNALKGVVQQQAEEKAAEAARTIRVPIKYRRGGTPVIDVQLNEQYTFEMIVDTGAGMTVITELMARTINLQRSGWCQVRVADGRLVTLEWGWARSVAVQSASISHVRVAVIPDRGEGLLGQDFFAAYDVRVLAQEVEFYRR
ncbi:MAG: tetratricopeptide repeat protein [Elainellaceae cyanobacterium]